MSNSRFSWNWCRILWAFAWSDQYFSTLAPFSDKSYFLKGVNFWLLRNREPKFCPLRWFFQSQMLWNGKNHSETTDIGGYRLKLKNKYKEFGEFNMSYHAFLLRYLQGKRNSSVREVLNLNILSYFVGSEVHFSKSSGYCKT